MTRRTSALLVLAVLVVGAGCGGWYYYRTPALPLADLSEEAPAVVAAIQAAEQKVRSAPRSGQAWGELGMVYLGNELSAPAHACFIQAERCDPAKPAWPFLQSRRLLVDDRDAAILALRRAVALTTPLTAGNVTPTLALAETLLENDERTDAGALCRQVLDVEPGNTRAEYNLGLIALADQQWDAAIAHLTRCGRDAHAGKRACAQLATAYQRQGNFAAAAAFSRRYRELPEDRPWPDPYLEEAQQYAAGPHRHLLHAQRFAGTAVGAQGRQEYLQALAELATEKGDGVAHYQLGMALAMMGDYAAAEPVLRTALAKSPDLVGAHYFLGMALMQQRKFGEGARHLRQAIARKPTHAQAHLLLGRCLARCDQPAEAIAEYRLAVQCRPDLSDGHLELAEALAAAGERAEAERHYKQAQRLAPADPRPAEGLARLRGGGTKKQK